jgi:hypothetical protein
MIGGKRSAVHSQQGKLIYNELIAMEAEAEEARQRTDDVILASRGQHQLTYEHAREKYKPIIEATTGKNKTDVIDTVRDTILNSTKLSNPEKLTVANELDRMKLTSNQQPSTSGTINPVEERRTFLDRALRIQDDRVFGINVREKINDDAVLYDFGFEKLYTHTNQIGSHVGIDIKDGLIGYDYQEDAVFPFSKDLVTLLTSNTIVASAEAKKQYMEIIDATIGKYLKMFKDNLDNLHRLEEREEGETDPRFIRCPRYRDVHAQCVDNVKFMKWIAPKYKIPTRLQPKRGGGLEADYVKPQDKSPWEPTPITIVIPPNADDRLKRAFVLLGKKRSGKEDIPAELAEFSALLDALLKDKKIDITQYSSLMNKYK